MIRALLFVMLVLVGSREASGQELSVLHIKVAVVDAERKATPVSRHMLLISDKPTTAPPRQVVTARDGTADVRLRPGNYTVESDQPVAFNGKAYQWTQMIDIVAGRDAILELTAENAEVEAATATTAAAAPLQSDPSFLLTQWQNSIVALWTPSRHASGFLIDAKGLVVTSQRGIGTATSVEVQLSRTLKVAASVLAADAERDVAVLWIDPKIAASMTPLAMACAQTERPDVVDGQDLFTIGAPLREEKGMTSGTVSRVESHAIEADFRLASGSAGGPVFTAAGGVVGLTSIGDDTTGSGRRSFRVVRIDNACNVVAMAENKMKGAAPPNGTSLPVEPLLPFPEAALRDAAQRRAGSLNPYQMSSADFDIAFMTPVLVYGARAQSERMSGRRDARSANPEPAIVRPLTDFGTWSEYMEDNPPVLLVRVTPKLVENFWTTMARGAARTQGVALPPLKHVKAGFSRLRAWCGDVEVIPIHPFTVEQRVSESDAIDEGLYVFDPAALGPHCGSVGLMLYSEKAPEKEDTRVVDPKVLQQIWQDFAPYRER
jgi:S1-C subfamily serine protease